ncbi:MAG: hypothetical protein GX444_01500 [Myxococcales bacterium]|nr:hypothetical protein [Myxococcales bacterium]
MKSAERTRLGWTLAVALTLGLLLPGIRYFNPTNRGIMDLFWLLFFAWIPVGGLLLLPARYRPTKWIPRIQLALGLITGLALLQSVLYLGAILAVFYRWIGLLAVLLVLVFLGRFFRSPRPRLLVLLVAAAVIPLAGMLCSWWNFLMIGAGRYQPGTEQAPVRLLIDPTELKSRDPQIGKAHPYFVEYDAPADLLVASFKDDWGAIYPRFDRERHNYLVMRRTNGEPQWRLLYFGPSQQPENIKLDPDRSRGWVNVLDPARHTFHLAAFSYAGDELRQTAFGELPVEPNALFYHADQDRLFVLGMRRELVELDPVSLKIRAQYSFNYLLNNDVRNTELHSELIRTLKGEELVNLTAYYRLAANTLYLGGLGRRLHAVSFERPIPPVSSADEAAGLPPVVSLSRGTSRRVALGPEILQLDYDAEWNELWAGLPLQREVVALDGDTLAIKRRFAATVAVRPLAVLPGTDYLLTGDYAADRTVLLDRRDGAVKAVYRLGRLQRHAVADPAAPRAFVATGWGVFEVRVAP